MHALLTLSVPLVGWEPGRCASLTDHWIVCIALGEEPQVRTQHLVTNATPGNKCYGEEYDDVVWLGTPVTTYILNPLIYST